MLLLAGQAGYGGQHQPNLFRSRLCLSHPRPTCIYSRGVKQLGNFWTLATILNLISSLIENSHSSSLEEFLDINHAMLQKALDAERVQN